jgi:glycosyltransferase involved in cell wall biosynthesis
MIQGGGKQVGNDISKQPLISIIIATFNAGNVLKDAIQSIITFAPKDVELIVIDGNSTDNTIAVLKQYDKYITHWQSEADRGIYDALNKGLKLFKGRWVYFMGADDRLLIGFTDMMKVLKSPKTLYYGNVETDGPLFLGEFSEYRLAKYCVNHQTIIYPALVFEKYTFNTRYKVLADYALNIACWGDRTFTKKHYPFNIAFYSTKGYSSTTIDELFQIDKPSLIKKHMSRLTYLRFLLKRIKESHKPGGVFKAVNP